LLCVGLAAGSAASRRAKTPQAFFCLALPEFSSFFARYRTITRRNRFCQATDPPARNYCFSREAGRIDRFAADADALDPASKSWLRHSGDWAVNDAILLGKLSTLDLKAAI
jgi:hypothetical protein